ncbi:MAG: TIGR00296 family protein [archaeon]
MLSLGVGRLLVRLARDAVSSKLAGSALNPDYASDSLFSESRGVFVTLHKNNDLRGCIGFPEPVLPLREAIVSAAIAAAFEDPRFPPVLAEEFNEVEFEVSVLTIPTEVNRDRLPNSILVGRDGLIVKLGHHSGLLLPQVPVEWNWNSAEFLNQTCIKAGLPPGSWKNTDCRILSFRAQVFAEQDGSVVEKALNSN